MASEKDDKKKAKPAAAKAAKPAAEAAAEKPAKAAKAAAPKKAAAPYDGPPCRVEGCKQPVRAKGYCRKHFIGWRRGERWGEVMASATNFSAFTLAIAVVMLSNM